jgi:hypothetical protein
MRRSDEGISGGTEWSNGEILVRSTRCRLKDGLLARGNATSRLGDLNPRPTHYESVSHSGRCVATALGVRQPPSLFRLVRSTLVEQHRAARSGSPHPSLLVGDGPKRLLPMIRGHFGGTLIDWPGVAQIILIKAQRPARHTGLGSVSIHEPRHDDRAVMFVIPVLRSGTSAGDVPT